MKQKMEPNRAFFFRGMAAGLFISMSYSCFVTGSWLTAIFALAITAILAHAALGQP
jgi:CHASE2 domain-containing sensor protein